MKTSSNSLRISLLGGALFLVFSGLGPVAMAQGPHAKITAEQARTMALKKYPGKVVGKISLENEEGSWQYAVNVRSGKTLREVMVNANNGKIANVEITTKAEEQKEAKAEAAPKMHSASHMSSKPGKP